MSDHSEGGESAFEFFGSWREFAALALTNLLLIVVTLGFYRFWAKARVRRYLWSHTNFIGDPLEWTGTGKELLIGFLFAIFLFGPPFLILNFGVQALRLRGHPGAALVTFWAAYSILLLVLGLARFRALRYKLSRTFWCGIRGGSDDRGLSYGFSALWKQAVGTVAIGLLVPWSMISLWNQRWRAMSFGSQSFMVDARAKRLMGRYLVLYIVSPLLFLILILCAMATFGGWIGPAIIYSEAPLALRILLFAVILVAVIVMVAMAWLAYFAAFYREAINGMTLGDLEFQFDASTDDWLKLFFGDAFLLVGTLGVGYIFLAYRHWKFFIGHLQATGQVTLAALTQSKTRTPGQGEGLLDAFDVGAF